MDEACQIASGAFQASSIWVAAAALGLSVALASSAVAFSGGRTKL